MEALDFKGVVVGRSGTLAHENQCNPFGADAGLPGYVSNWYLSWVDARLDDERRLLIIDDDALTRELLCLQAADAGADGYGV